MKVDTSIVTTKVAEKQKDGDQETQTLSEHSGKNGKAAADNEQPHSSAGGVHCGPVEEAAPDQAASASTKLLVAQAQKPPSVKKHSQSEQDLSDQNRPPPQEEPMVVPSTGAKKSEGELASSLNDNTGSSSLNSAVSR